MTPFRADSEARTRHCGICAPVLSHRATRTIPSRSSLIMDGMRVMSSRAAAQMNDEMVWRGTRGRRCAEICAHVRRNCVFDMIMARVVRGAYANSRVSIFQLNIYCNPTWDCPLRNGLERCERKSYTVSYTVFKTGHALQKNRKCIHYFEFAIRFIIGEYFVRISIIRDEIDNRLLNGDSLHTRCTSTHFLLPMNN